MSNKYDYLVDFCGDEDEYYLKSYIFLWDIVSKYIGYPVNQETLNELYKEIEEKGF